tara:strand:+ start:713 stop:2215 length:1503 start_codon:yes stop_codon:yes gene_type:complete
LNLFFLLKKILVFLFLILVIELLFYFSFKVSGNYLLENRYETEKRSHFYKGILKKNKKKDHYKIAVFGGSSANGYGSTINFSQILNNMAVISNNNVHIDNHSIPATPFYLFQAEKIKRVINEYDMFIIYAGHNEWLHFDHLKSFFPNNAKTTNYEMMKESWNKKISKDTEEIDSKNYYTSGGNFLFNDFNDKIRILNFVYRVTVKIKNKLKNLYYSNFVKKKVDFQSDNLKYYYSKKFFDDSNYKKFWTDNFKKSISEINDIIKPNQRVIIITPLTNYLLPPMADYSEQQSNKKEKILSDFYEKISNKEKLNLIELNKLEEGAHKSYLLAYYCKNNSKNSFECIDKYIESKNLDQQTITIIKPIQDFIKKEIPKNFKKFEVLDLTDFNNKIASNELDFLDFFVDVMHPSKYGHSYIANKLAKLIFNDQVSVDLNYNMDTPRCPELIYKVNNKIIKNLKTSKKACEKTISLIQNWHKDYWNYIPKNTRSYSEFYMSKSNKL